MSLSFKSMWPFGRKNAIADANAALVAGFLKGYASQTGAVVTPATVMRVSTCFACVRNISEDMAKLPLHLYKRLPRGKERAVKHPLYPLLRSTPNSWQTSFEFVQMLTAHMLLRGNGYARIVRGYGGRVLELLPLQTGRMQVKQLENFELSYGYADSRGRVIQLDPPDVLHLRGLTLDGVVGVTPIEYAREAFGLALAAEEHGSRMFGGRVTGPGVLKHPGKLSDPAFKRLQESWRENGGLENAAAPVILEEGLAWESLGLKLSDLQFLETRKYQGEEVARLYRMPPHKVGIMDKATFSNIENQSQEYVTDTLLPWALRWEQALARDVLTEQERQDFYASFLFNNLLRGDTKTRGEFYRSLHGVGALSANDILEMEDMDTYEGGDMRFVPLNMVPVDMARDAAIRKGGGSGAGS
ncbi:phage portal protein [Chromobacterium haemolyticum]|uniref:phage portal protein n=1 Tax=Chromobacterium haemolyticum TaxID=394935 RepID=UPI0009D9E9EB|nr:phage portal protein [Chromobacterium haemolyticum]OQS41828.1 phage portal protein [Chromobacterium haemolyticum]